MISLNMHAPPPFFFKKHAFCHFLPWIRLYNKSIMVLSTVVKNICHTPLHSRKIMKFLQIFPRRTCIISLHIKCIKEISHIRWDFHYNSLFSTKITVDHRYALLNHRYVLFDYQNFWEICESFKNLITHIFHISSP